MEVISPHNIFIIALIFFLIALLYSSVGHGGASGYIMVLSFLALSPKIISTTSLTLNIFVSTLAFLNFKRGGYFSLKFSLPFVLGSFPFAFIGSIIPVSDRTYFSLLGIVLLFVGVRFLLEFKTIDYEKNKTPNIFIAFFSGSFIGFLSGIVGIGGGVFLSPLILLMKWADSKTTAATCAFFILINSLSGLSGRFLGGSFQFENMIIPFVLTTFFGGMLGSYLGANSFSKKTIKQILGSITIFASFKFILNL